MVRGINGGDNPFLKRYDMDIPGAGQNGGIQQPDNVGSGEDQAVKGADKGKEAHGVKKPGAEEGAASNNSNANPEAKLDRTQFTNEDDIQEIDLQDFDDELR